MKNRWMILLMVAATGLLFIAVGALTAGDVPDDVIIDNKGYKSDKKGPVKLSHKKHATKKPEGYGAACTECHHEYQDGKNVWKEGQPVKNCVDCHSPLKSVKENGKVYKLNLAYHKNCKKCHKKVVAEGKKAPYKKCNDCHEKKAK